MQLVPRACTRVAGCARRRTPYAFAMIVALAAACAARRCCVRRPFRMRSRLSCIVAARAGRSAACAALVDAVYDDRSICYKGTVYTVMVLGGSSVYMQLAVHTAQRSQHPRRTMHRTPCDAPMALLCMYSCLHACLHAVPVRRGAWSCFSDAYNNRSIRRPPLQPAAQTRGASRAACAGARAAGRSSRSG